MLCTNTLCISTIGSCIYKVLFFIFLFFISGALARLVDFLLSPLFTHTYSDALSLGSIPTTITPQARRLCHDPFPSSSQIHISRVDSFLLTLEALASSVERLVHVYWTLAQVIDFFYRILIIDKANITSFVGQLGNKLYTADVVELYVTTCTVSYNVHVYVWTIAHGFSKNGSKITSHFYCFF